ncbi:hypothetical protein HDC90_002960 [Pedobacter sp. AK013]|nr:hypothetical protein [Pedobacter sp. AK013]
MFFGAQCQEHLLKLVPVLRNILSLCFRDAATPGAKNTVITKNKVQNAISFLVLPQVK